MSGDYTRISCLFWGWPPMETLDPTTIKLWLVIYTQKVNPPGLWHGSVVELASQARLSNAETLHGLDNLVARELVQFDHLARVLRLTRLPDAGEWPAAPSVLRSWWSKFKKVPPCAVRDVHVETLRWILDQGARDSEKAKGVVSEAHEAIWKETFGNIRPTSVPRFDNRYDTSTEHQPSLFAAPTPVDKSSGVESLSRGSPVPLTTEKIRSGSPSGEGQETEEEQETEFFRSVPEGGALSAAAESANDPNATKPRPKLTLVPPAYAPFTVEQLLGILNNQGLTVRESERCALQDAILGLDGIPEGEDTLALLRGWRRMAVLDLVVPGALRTEVSRARARKQQADAQIAALREARERAGV